ncbi:hypothetical protein M378DRAFT_172980 [Amanita muscaria Koide BX008]|uniref:Uncharacterized protein n=1 Tax=Amanita muscaria (strain Koide BX008) TaxID=946122 RepID=A0A0C2WJ11_AMAMK|nr:hypothetical protein M378DRAFT_172980 [Amanita muscaria Koide BX008]
MCRQVVSQSHLQHGQAVFRNSAAFFENENEVESMQRDKETASRIDLLKSSDEDAKYRSLGLDNNDNRSL